MSNLPPPVESRLAAIRDRWHGYVSRATQAVELVLAAAVRDAKTQIDADLFADGAFAAVLSAAGTKVHHLRDRVDEAWETTERLLDDLRDEADLAGGAQLDLEREIDRLASARATLIDDFDVHRTETEVEIQAERARRLYAEMAREVESPQTCPECRTALDVRTYWQWSNVACRVCGQAQSVGPGRAAALYFQGGGVHALADEQAFDLWRVEHDAERAFKALRHPAARDYETWLGAARVRWTRYYETSRDLNPGFAGAFPGGVAGAVDDKLSHYERWDAGSDQQRRAFFDRLVGAAEAGDRAELIELVERRPHMVDPIECADALVERGARDEASVVLAVVHRLGDEDTPREAWIAEQLAELEARWSGGQ